MIILNVEVKYKECGIFKGSLKHASNKNLTANKLITNKNIKRIKYLCKFNSTFSRIQSNSIKSREWNQKYEVKSQ